MHYIEKCLNSLIKQKVKNLEILIINDGSEDDSLFIIKKFYFKYPYIIRYFNTPNRGLGAARNLGIMYARGNYIGFVDSDDWVDSNMYLYMIKYIIKYQADIVMCNISKEDCSGKLVNKLNYSDLYSVKYFNLQKDFSLFSELSCFACNKLFKRNLFENMLFIENIYFEDIATIASIFLHAYKIVKINKLYYHYVNRPYSITNTYNIHYLDIYKAISIVKKNFL
jgi:glycosyltransferase involved in cell wall biosynthesis